LQGNAEAQDLIFSVTLLPKLS